MRRLPSIQALRCFVTVARLGSVTKAARELNLTHAAVSMQLRNLEQLLGGDLFVRDVGRMALNAAGSQYMDMASRVLQELTSETELMQGKAMCMQGSV